MNKCYKSYCSVAIAVIAMFISASASAYTINVGGIAVTDQGLTTSEVGATVIDFNSGSMPTGYSGGAVKLGNSSGQWASPPGDTTYYYTVGESGGQPSPGIANLGSLHQYFGYFGGSPDTYNSIELWRDGTQLAVFSGSDLAAAAAVNPNGDQSTGAYWNIWAENSSEYFNIVKFISTRNAFETDNHAFVSAVPIPASAWLFASGLLGLFGYSSRKKAA